MAENAPRLLERAAIALLTVLCLSAVAVVGQEQAVAGGEGTRFVCLDEDRRAFASEAGPGRHDGLWQHLDAAAAELPLTHCWAWSDTCPPQRLVPGDDPVRACEAASASNGRLSLRVVQPAAGSDPATPGERRGALQVTAAPAAMWGEVPRSLLPVVVTTSTSLSLPRSAGSWRAQAIAEKHASPWVEVAATEDAVALTLMPSSEYSRVITADAAPLAAARFYLVRPGSIARMRPTERLGFASSDSEGRIRLTLPARHRSPVVVSSATRMGVAFLELQGVPATIELEAGFWVSGQLVDETGEPVEAQVLGSSDVPDSFGLRQRHESRSGSDGRFELTGFPRGAMSLRADAGDLEFARSLTLDDSVDLGRIVLGRPERVWIQVLDAETGAGIAGGRVNVFGGDTTIAGDDGLVAVSTRADRRIGVGAEGYTPERVDLPRGVGTSPQEPFGISLSPAFTIEGRYVAADGQTPAIGGRLTTRRSNTFTVTNLEPDGSFSIDLRPGGWELELMAGNTGVRRLEVRGAPREVRRLGVIVAPASAWVSGYVVTEAFAPVSGASVSYLRPSEYGPVFSSMIGDIAEVATNGEGYFELHGLELGASNLRVEADGFAPRQFTVEAEAVDWVDAGTIQLSRGRQVTIRSDVDRGRVELDPGLKGLPEDRLEGMLIEGEAVVEAVPDAPFNLVVYVQGEPVCERAEEDRKGDVVVTCNRRTMRVQGRVTMSGQPSGGKLWWSEKRSISGGLEHAVVSSEFSRRPYSFEVQLDSEGHYRWDAVLPGDWDVSWSPPGGGFQERREITVPDGPGEEVTLNFDYGGVSIEGVVSDPDGRPVQSATIDIFPERSWVVSDQDGRFQVLGLAPGTYRVRARFRLLRSEFVDVELRDYNDRQTVHLELREDPPNDELVIRLAGAGSGFCFVEMEGSSQRVPRIDGGVATVRLPPPLSDRVRIACQADGRWILTGWQDLERALERGLDFDPFEADSSIVLEGDSSTAAVQVTGPGGWDVGKLRIWFGGGTTFSVGETISNLPVGEYTLRWGNQVRTVWTERRRAAEVEIED